MLPFDQFAFAELKSDGKQQELRLVFATHEVLLRGHSLRRIEIALQRMELSLLTAWPGKQRALVTEGQPVVQEIVVTQVEKQRARNSTAAGNADESGCDANCQQVRNGGQLNLIERT